MSLRLVPPLSRIETGVVVASAIVACVIVFLGALL